MPVIFGFAEDSIQLVPDGTLVLHVIIILIMVYVLNATLYKPINQILASREKRTRGRLSEAQEIMQSVSEKTGEYGCTCSTRRFTSLSIRYLPRAKNARAASI